MSESGTEIGREQLSYHDTIATYQGVMEKPCMFRTSLCPNECGHGGKFAQFSILGYQEYQKPGKYGDEKQHHFTVKLDGNGAASQDIVKQIEALPVGATVDLNWSHDYVERQYPGGGTSKGPERPITKLEVVDEKTFDFGALDTDLAYKHG